MGNLKKPFFICVALAFALSVFSIANANAPKTSTSRHPLVVQSGTIWQTKQIGVCWENKNGTGKEEGWVRDAVRNSWEANSQVRFVGWRRCGSEQKGIRIRVEDTGPHVTALGSKLDGKRGGMKLNFTFKKWPCRPYTHEQCIKWIAVHEFGHALGFSHEQNRSDAPNWCSSEAQGSSGDIFITPYDLNSVMNYCSDEWNGRGNLSSYDKQGLQLYYGATAGSAIPYAPDCNSSVVVYEHTEFRGKRYAVPGTLSNIKGNDRLHDEISSVCVPAGFRFVGYEDTRFRGKSFSVDGPGFDVNLKSVPNVGNFNDKISSYRIINLRTNEYVYQAPPACIGTAAIFQDRDFGGKRAYLSTRNNYQRLDGVDKNFNFNDQVSSICVPPGYKLTAWEHTNFRGSSFTIGRNYFDSLVPNLKESSWNDKIGSLRLEKIKTNTSIGRINENIELTRHNSKFSRSGDNEINSDDWTWTSVSYRLHGVGTTNASIEINYEAREGNRNKSFGDTKFVLNKTMVLGRFGQSIANYSMTKVVEVITTQCV